MFTIHIYLKFAIIFLCLVGGTVLAFLFGFWYAFPFLLIGLLFLASYILLGTVQSAAQLVEKTQFAAAQKRLDLTWKPNWLYKPNRAYYYIMKGTMAAQMKDNEEAEKWFMTAKQIGVPSGNEAAMVELQLANLMAVKKKWQAAKNHLRAAKKQKITEPQLREQVKQFEKAFTNRGQLKHLQGQQGGSRKSRRVRR